MTITNDAAHLVDADARRAATLGIRPMPAAGLPRQATPGMRAFAAMATGEPLRDLSEVRSAGGVLDHAAKHAGTAGPDDPSADADGLAGLLLRVNPGDRLRLKLDGSRGRQHTSEIPDDHPAGLHWYPSHPAGEQVKGAPEHVACPMIVSGDVDRLPGIVGTRERVMVLNGFRPDGILRGFTMNGQVQPEIDIQPGEIQRWRLANADPRRGVWLHVEGHTLHQIGQDGLPFSRIRPVQSIFLAPGNRAEFLIRANKTGEYRIYAPNHSASRTGGLRPITELATMAVSGRSIFSRLPRQLGGPAFPDMPAAVSRTMQVRAADAGGRPAARLHLDGRTLTPGRLAHDAGAAATTVEDWTLVNDDGHEHLVHVDGHPFQVVNVGGAPAGDPSWQAEPDTWRDTYRLPPHGQVTIRVRLVRLQDTSPRK